MAELLRDSKNKIVPQYFDRVKNSYVPISIRNVSGIDVSQTSIILDDSGNPYTHQYLNNDGKWYVYRTQTPIQGVSEYPNIISKVVVERIRDGNGGVGTEGPKGDKGDPGERGPAGSSGPSGPKGDAGAKGDKGDAGAKGDKGDVGAQGPIGLTGPQGPKGETGAQGVKGDTGATGPKGDKGDKGDAGPKGDDGLVGPQGPKGEPGNDAVVSTSVAHIKDIAGSTFGQKINNAMASGIKFLELEMFGDYSLATSDSINYSNITIIGYGSTIRTSLPDMQTVGNNVHIKNVNFIDTSTSYNSSVFMLYSTKNAIFERCKFSTPLSHVFRLFGEDGEVITNVKFKDCIFNNIVTGLTFYGEFDNIIFDGNEFSNVSDNVISGVGEGSTVGMTKRGFYFTNNIVYDCGRMIIEIKRSQDIIIKDNDFRHNDYFVASLIGCRDIKIENNIIEICGIEIGPETGTDFPVTNVNISSNTFRNMEYSSIMLNSGESGSIIRGVTISKNVFSPNLSEERTIEYAGMVENISDINITDNLFDSSGELRVIGIFKGNTVVCRDTWYAVEAFDNSIIINNIIKPSSDCEEGYGSLIKLSGDNVIIDNNILQAGNKFFSCVSDQGGTRLNTILTNNKFLNAATANVSFVDTSTFVDIQGNTYVGTTRCDGYHWNNAQPIATNIGRGLFFNPGNPNTSTNSNFGRFGSICIDTINYEMYIKVNFNAPYWVLK